MCVINLHSQNTKVYDVIDCQYPIKRKISFRTVGRKILDAIIPGQYDQDMFITDNKTIRFTDEFLDLVSNSPNGIFFANGKFGYWYGWTWDPNQRNVLRLIQMSYRTHDCNGTVGLFYMGPIGELSSRSPRPKRQLDIQDPVYCSYIQVTGSNGKTKQRPTSIIYNVPEYNQTSSSDTPTPVPYSYFNNPWYQISAPWWTGYYNYLMEHRWY